MHMADEGDRGATRGRGGRLGSLTARLAVLLAAFIVVTTVGVVIREYAVGETRRIEEIRATLQVEATFAADRLEGALAERQRLVDLWAGLESSQDLAVNDVDARVSTSLAGLVAALGNGTEAVAMRADTLLAASDSRRLGEAVPVAPQVQAVLDRRTAGVSVTGPPGNGWVVAAADVRSAVDGSLLGRIVAWTPLDRFLATAIPLELATTRVVTPEGEVLARGRALEEVGTRYLWARHTARTVAGELVVAVAAPREEVSRALRATGRQLVTLAGLFLLLALPASLVLTRTATSSLARLTRAARELDPMEPGPMPPVSSLAPTEVKVLADAITAMVRRLEEARERAARAESLAAVGMLTKSLAHEIRTPLSVLRAGTEMLAREVGDTARRREVIDMLDAEVARLTRLMNDLLVFGRPSPPAPVETTLDHVAAGALQALEPMAADQGVTLEAKLDGAPLRADPDLLRQVVVNLVTNAVRASSRGGRVTVRTAARDDTVELEVADHGVGIAPEMLDEIWKPLVTTHRSGNGLGLPIVRQLVEAHGGRIEVDSRPGEGTSMTIILPASGPPGATGGGTS